MRHAQTVEFLVLIMLGVGVLAHTAVSETGRGPAAIQLDNAWIRRTSLTGQVEQGGHGGSMMTPEESTLYVTVRNHGSEPDALLAASSEAAASGVLYETLARESTTVRQPRKQFDIPAGSTLEMKPGSAHIVLLGLKQALSPGETVSVLLIFQKAGPVSVDALVK